MENCVSRNFFEVRITKKMRQQIMVPYRMAHPRLLEAHTYVAIMMKSSFIKPKKKSGTLPMTIHDKFDFVTQKQDP